MSSRPDDEQDPGHALFLRLQAESVRNVAEREANMAPEEKARREAKDAEWLAERDASHAARKAPKPPKARKPPKAPKPEASRKRKRTDDSETGGGQVTETSSENPEGGPSPQKRGRGRPKGSKNKPKAGQAGAQQLSGHPGLHLACGAMGTYPAIASGRKEGRFWMVFLYLKPLPEDIGSFEDEDMNDLDEDDLFGDGLLEEPTIAEVQHGVGSFEDEDDLFGDS
ncbi:hypothetical protein QBC32DRAFT_383277 [Pseudoneurospora amorphoporcata]|uniref:Uncharacterized protein n=1 Tax=Pseudoneurospora amorphoporcata TaxID=241081 RepID=A0AAN6NZ93_9PEZI|nr:hypothetical protein QBC32DRAFT_383277 [Pseudoneurospora amorphoporcata]